MPGAEQLCCQCFIGIPRNASTSPSKSAPMATTRVLEMVDLGFRQEERRCGSSSGSIAPTHLESGPMAVSY